MHEEYFGDYRVLLSEGGQALHVGEADRDEECGGSNPAPHGDGDIFELFPPTKSC